MTAPTPSDLQVAPRLGVGSVAGLLRLSVRDDEAADVFAGAADVLGHVGLADPGFERGDDRGRFLLGDPVAVGGDAAELGARFVGGHAARMPHLLAYDHCLAN